MRDPIQGVTFTQLYTFAFRQFYRLFLLNNITKDEMHFIVKIMDITVKGGDKFHIMQRLQKIWSTYGLISSPNIAILRRELLTLINTVANSDIDSYKTSTTLFDTSYDDYNELIGNQLWIFLYRLTDPLIEAFISYHNFEHQEALLAEIISCLFSPAADSTKVMLLSQYADKDRAFQESKSVFGKNTYPLHIKLEHIINVLKPNPREINKYSVIYSGTIQRYLPQMLFTPRSKELMQKELEEYGSGFLLGPCNAEL